LNGFQANAYLLPAGLAVQDTKKQQALTSSRTCGENVSKLIFSQNTGIGR